MANIQIQNLPSASSPLNGGAYTIIKDGLQDKKATVTQLREIDISAFTNLPSPVASDLIMIGRASNTYKTLFQNVGLIKGTKCWFYNNVAPSGWTIVPGVGDALLGVLGGGIYINAGVGFDGDWQQTDHTLTVNEIPSHSHRIPAGKDSSGSSGTRYARRATDLDTDTTITSASEGGGVGHNHGDTWRPKATVGIICSKDN